MTVTTTFTTSGALATETIYPLTTTFTPPAACSGIQWDETSALWVVNEFPSPTHHRTRPRQAGARCCPQS